MDLHERQGDPGLGGLGPALARRGRPPWERSAPGQEEPRTRGLQQHLVLGAGEAEQGLLIRPQADPAAGAREPRQHPARPAQDLVALGAQHERGGGRVRAPNGQAQLGSKGDARPVVEGCGSVEGHAVEQHLLARRGDQVPALAAVERRRRAQPRVDGGDGCVETDMGAAGPRLAQEDRPADVHRPVADIVDGEAQPQRGLRGRCRLARQRGCVRRGCARSRVRGAPLPRRCERGTQGGAARRARRRGPSSGGPLGMGPPEQASPGGPEAHRGPGPQPAVTTPAPVATAVV